MRILARYARLIYCADMVIRSVRLQCVTLRGICIRTTKRIVDIVLPPDLSITLVFCNVISLRKANGVFQYLPISRESLQGYVYHGLWLPLYVLTRYVNRVHHSIDHDITNETIIF